MSGLDMKDRDPNHINEHIKIQFEDSFAEPAGDSAKSIDCVWRCTYVCFNCTLSCCYKTLTLMCACPTAFCWACDLACLTCCQVWCWTPYINYLRMSLVPYRRCFVLYLEAFCGPCCEMWGLCCSRVQVTVRNV